METVKGLCQSCGMPLSRDPEKGGTQADNSTSDKFCSFCFRDGRFLDEGISLQEKIDKNVQIAVTRLNVPESKARTMAEDLLPRLERWRS